MEKIYLLEQIAEAVKQLVADGGFEDTEVEFNSNEEIAVVISKKYKKMASFVPQMAINLEEQHGYEDGILELSKIILSTWRNNIPS